MARASENISDWNRMLNLLDKESLDAEEESELKELQLFFRGKSNRGEKNKLNKSKPITLIAPDGSMSVYKSRKDLMHQAGIASSGLYDAILRNDGMLKPKKWAGFKVKEME